MGKSNKVQQLWVDSKPVPDGYWKERKNRIAYMRWLEKTSNIKKSEDWLKITKKTFYDNRGLGFLACNYGDSPIAALREYKPKLTRCEWLLITRYKNSVRRAISEYKRSMKH